MGVACRTQVAETRRQAAGNESTVKYVIIVTYQRCGSSFFGNVFNLNPYAFYAYEPLDSLYSSLYGTTPGWNVPSDITNNPDGSARCERTLTLSCLNRFRNWPTLKVRSYRMQCVAVPRGAA